jgi:hypothetical protein
MVPMILEVLEKGHVVQSIQTHGLEDARLYDDIEASMINGP